MTKLLCAVFVLFVAVPGVPVAALQVDTEGIKSINDAYNDGAKLGIEMRRLRMEERRLYLSSIHDSQLTEERALAISNWILRNLKDYPQGKKAKHMQEDSELLAEVMLNIKTPKP